MKWLGKEELIYEPNLPPLAQTKHIYKIKYSIHKPDASINDSLRQVLLANMN